MTTAQCETKLLQEINNIENDENAMVVEQLFAEKCRDILNGTNPIENLKSFLCRIESGEEDGYDCYDIINIHIEELFNIMGTEPCTKHKQAV